MQQRDGRVVDEAEGVADRCSRSPGLTSLDARRRRKSEAAEQLGVSLRTIERLISAGRLPVVHVGGAARVRVADLGAYVQGLGADNRTTLSTGDDR